MQWNKGLGSWMVQLPSSSRIACDSFACLVVWRNYSFKFLLYPHAGVNQGHRFHFQLIDLPTDIVI